MKFAYKMYAANGRAFIPTRRLFESHTFDEAMDAGFVKVSQKRSSPDELYLYLTPAGLKELRRLARGLPPAAPVAHSPLPMELKRRIILRD
jgi:hypothetical protein